MAFENKLKEKCYLQNGLGMVSPFGPLDYQGRRTEMQSPAGSIAKHIIQDAAMMPVALTSEIDASY